MDRGYRALLSLLAAGGLLGWASGGPELRAQSSPTPGATAKPISTPAAKPVEGSTPSANPAVSLPQQKPSALPKPAARGPEQESVRDEQDDAKFQGSRRPSGRQSVEQQLIEPETPLPDEQTSLNKNVRLWRKLLPEEQKALVGPASERIREETEQAYEQSNLNLNDDQREVFALRYRQERRRLERELQEKANNERTRRLPQIIDQLKREFSRAATPAPQQNVISPVSKPPATQAPTSTPAPTMPGGSTGNLQPPVPSKA